MIVEISANWFTPSDDCTAYDPVRVDAPPRSGVPQR
jgi:hypothetical protein